MILFRLRQKRLRVELQWGPVRPLELAQAVIAGKPLGSTLSIAAAVLSSTSSAWAV